MNPLRHPAMQLHCATCKSYAWSGQMAAVRGLDGQLHHPSCPDVRQLDERQSMLRGGRLVSPWR